MAAGEIYGKRILYAVLNWGLGHATRSAVLIRQLLAQNNQVILVSSGAAQQFLKAEFPQCLHENLPAREIFYPAHRQLWLKLLQQQSSIFGNIEQEKKTADRLCLAYQPQIIISDNCYGFYSKYIHSVLLTHQVNIQAPFFERSAQKRIHRLLQPFHEIWIPDLAGDENLSGKLSRPLLPEKKFVFVGVLSSLAKSESTMPEKFAYCAIVSGPEKQRSLFEKQVIDFLKAQKQPAVLVRGTQQVLQHTLPEYIQSIDFCGTQPLQRLIQQSATIIGRTGYSSIMDLYTLQKPCILMPTPGQTEQEYLFTKHFGRVKAQLQNMQARVISPCKA